MQEGGNMSDDGGWDIVTAVIVPLAERLEAASKAAYPAGTRGPRKSETASTPRGGALFE